jgi:VWFA-related protein
MTKRSLSIALLVFLTSVAGAQLPPLVERVNVSVINVDVTVTNRAGAPVTDLTPDDFEVLEDGKPQKITNFYVVDHAAVRDELAGSSNPAPSARFRRKAVLLVDNHFIDKKRRNDALVQLRKFIDSDYASDYDWSIGIISAGVHVIQPFTADKAAINATIDRVMGGGVIGQVVAIDHGPIGDPSEPVGATAVARRAFAERDTDLVNLDNDARFATSLEAIRASARAVIDACRAYASVDGKKLIVLVTSGMEIDNRQGDVRNWRPGDNDRKAAEIRESMVREANAANFNIYVVNAGGVTNPVAGFDVSQGETASLGEVRTLDSFPAALASQTGGMYLTSNTIGASIRKIDAISATFYSIGYRPSHFEDGKYHAIKVRVKKPGYEVFSRSGYLDQPSEQRLEDSLKVAAGALLPEGSLPVRIAVGSKVAKGRAFSVPVTISVPMHFITTLNGGDVAEGRVHLYLSVFDDSDANIAFEHVVQPVELSPAQVRQLAATPDANFRYGMKVELKPGVYRVVVALRDELSDELGKVSTVVDTR